MAKKPKPKITKIVDVGPCLPRIVDTTPTHRKITPEEFMAALGAERVTDPDEIAQCRILGRIVKPKKKAKSKKNKKSKKKKQK